MVANTLCVGGLESLPVTYFSVVLVATPELFPSYQTISINDLKQEVHIDVKESDLSFDSHDLMLLKGCRQWRTKDAYTLKNMLIEGLGWGYIPEFMVTEELKSGKLVKLELTRLEYTISGEIR